MIAAAFTRLHEHKKWSMEEADQLADYMFDYCDDEFLLVTDVLRPACQWLALKIVSLVNKSSNLSGRKELRQTIKEAWEKHKAPSRPDFLSMPASPAIIDMQPTRDVRPIPHGPPASQMNVQTILKGLSQFNGTETERYLIWKTELLDILDTTRFLENWNRVDVVLAATAGSVLSHEG